MQNISEEKLQQAVSLLTRGGPVSPELKTEMAFWMDVLNRLILSSIPGFHGYQLDPFYDRLAEMAVQVSWNYPEAFLQSQIPDDEPFVLEIQLQKGQERFQQKTAWIRFRLETLMRHLADRMPLHVENYRLLIECILFYSKICQSLQRLRSRPALPNDLERVVMVRSFRFMEVHLDFILNWMAEHPEENEL